MYVLNLKDFLVRSTKRDVGQNVHTARLHTMEVNLDQWLSNSKNDKTHHKGGPYEPCKSLEAIK